MQLIRSQTLSDLVHRNVTEVGRPLHGHDDPAGLDSGLIARRTCRGTTPTR